MDNAIWLSYNQGEANLAHVKTPLNTLKIRPFLERITPERGHKATRVES